MTLNPNSWHNSLYQFAYRERHDAPVKLPTNFCAYGWKLIFSILLLPFYWAGSIFNRFTPAPFKEKILMTVLSYVGYFFGGSIFAGITTKVLTSIYGGVDSLHVGIAFVVGPFVLGIFAYLGIRIISGLWDRSEKKREEDIRTIQKNYNCSSYEAIDIYRKQQDQNSAFYMFKQWFKSFKDKHCPLIDWKDKNVGPLWKEVGGVGHGNTNIYRCFFNGRSEDINQKGDVYFPQHLAGKFDHPENSFTSFEDAKACVEKYLTSEQE